MKKNEFEFIIASPYDKEELICEIYYKGDIIAEISQETSDLLLEIYSPIKSEWWSIPFLEFQEMLEVGKEHLLNNSN